MTPQDAGPQRDADHRQRCDQKSVRLRELLKPRPRRRPADQQSAPPIVRGRSRDEEAGA
ncbi:MAG: hypothetical protein U1E14_01630 [Geminicoccaceae bacterium]